ncbi:MAG: CDGSH iron-sulfur domain-containing protein [Candidatus Diapherotrites archaeon]
MAGGKKAEIVIAENGPYLVFGGLPLRKEIIGIGRDNEPEKWIAGEKFEKRDSFALCRCGASKNKPFCDGSHQTIGFNGMETALKKRYLAQAQRFFGPGIDLTDAPKLCAVARFCHRAGGTWKQVELSGNVKKRKLAIETACNCPSGRLVVWHKKTGRAIEPKFKPSIGLVEDPQAKCSGPIWVKGFVPIKSSDGTYYEERNRVTLCRCGASKNKPFCDGSHIRVKFNAGKN